MKLPLSAIIFLEPLAEIVVKRNLVILNLIQEVIDMVPRQTAWALRFTSSFFRQLYSCSKINIGPGDWRSFSPNVYLSMVAFLPRDEFWLCTWLSTQSGFELHKQGTWILKSVIHSPQSGRPDYRSNRF